MNANPTLLEDLFLNPVLTALQTTHAHLALTAGEATRYRPEVSPFAAVTAPTASALRDLHSLLAPGELIWLPGLEGADCAAAGLTLNTTLPCHQMWVPETVPLPATGPRIVALTCADSPAMVHLTDIGFPGFFKPHTCEMGHYYGIRSELDNSQLISMAGERLNFPGYSEISGICSHPLHRGRGHAASLIWEVVRRHRREGIVSWLHVSATNTRAIHLYLQLGFEIVRTIPLYQVAREV